MYLSRQKWAKVRPLAKGREEYWDELSKTTAFVGTATEEAYGLEYVEALMAGAVGILPDKPWARRLVPEGYPFLYTTKTEAEQMLLRAVSSPGSRPTTMSPTSTSSSRPKSRSGSADRRSSEGADGYRRPLFACQRRPTERARARSSNRVTCLLYTSDAADE